MQEKAKNPWLMICLVLILTFGILSAIEFIEVSNLERELSELKSSCVTSCSPDCTVPEESLIGFSEIGGFSYKRVDTMEEGESISFKDVTFTNLPLNKTYTGCIVLFFKFSFSDGTSEIQQITLCPTTFEPKVYFTNHTNPKAGVIYSLGHSPIVRGIYLMVQD